MRAGKRKLGVTGIGAAAALVLSLGGGVAMAGAAEPGAAEGTIRGAEAPGAVEGQYIVSLKGEAAAKSSVRTAVNSQAKSLVSVHGGDVEQVYSAAFRGFSVSATEAQAKKLAADPNVAYVEADGVAKISGTQPSPPSWGLDRVDGAADSSYTYPNEGAGVTAYVLDTGIDMTHPDFGGRATSGYDFIDNDADASDCQGHGTHVAGTVGGASFGVAKGVNLVSVRVLDCGGSGQWSQVIAGIDWVAQNASGPSIGNMSLGGGANDSVDAAVQGAINAGVQMAVAAGNNNSDACGSSPARVPAAVTLGSTDQGDGRSSFSNYGTCVDLFAPGGQINSTANGGGSQIMSGTSMASPHAAGAGAIYLSANPSATPQQVADALVGNAQSGVVGNPGAGSPNLLLNVSNLG
ncbi:S8 family peptidase [Streptomyces sp. XM4193]|uniref:S8 family peptidase n=1 Tax=Streptomyces sp. XM4193 TaxID=2929782 RepID=UPI001FF873DC|nr:S8 family peptidase [Streptomyces sp. XM4193]MCK1797403.1 S8 family peptidase [Streptomyces sp. XM4193]